MNNGKVILLGDASVGKTHLLTVFVEGKLPKAPRATVGVEFCKINVPLSSGDNISITFWDTAGQEIFKSVTTAHYRRALGCILVYDVMNRQSFLNVSTWLEEVRNEAEPDIAIILVGNKLDLKNQLGTVEKRQVSELEGAQYAEKNNLEFIETSAITGENVKKLFTRVADLLNERLQKNIAAPNISKYTSTQSYNKAKSVKGGVTFDNSSKENVKCCGILL